MTAPRITIQEVHAKLVPSTDRPVAQTRPHVWTLDSSRNALVCLDKRNRCIAEYTPMTDGVDRIGWSAGLWYAEDAVDDDTLELALNVQRVSTPSDEAFVVPVYVGRPRDDGDDRHRGGLAVSEASHLSDALRKATLGGKLYHEDMLTIASIWPGLVINSFSVSSILRGGVRRPGASINGKWRGYRFEWRQDPPANRLEVGKWIVALPQYERFTRLGVIHEENELPAWESRDVGLLALRVSQGMQAIRDENPVLNSMLEA